MAEMLDPANAPAKENLQPNGLLTEPDKPTVNTVAATKAAEPTLQQPVQRVGEIEGDDKIPVMSEPPTIQPVNTAPGMSATSGPLEDFPEGGAYHE